MSSRLVDNLVSGWTLTPNSPPREDWSGSSVRAWEFPGIARVPRYISEGDRVFSVEAKVSQAHPNVDASIQKTFDPPLNLKKFDEIRFWIRCDRIGDNRSPEHPFYLTFEAGNHNPPWRRLLPVTQSNSWELHSLWLGDMPDTLKQSVTLIRLAIQVNSLEPQQPFHLTLGDLIATRLDPLPDVEQELKGRLALIEKDLRKRLEALNAPAAPVPAIPVIIELPEAKLGKPTPPCIVITPWAVQPMRERGGSVDLIDNYTPPSNGKAGAHVRPVPWLTQLDYSIDVYARDRLQKSQLLTAIIQAFDQQPYLRISGMPLRLLSFTPSPEETASQVSPGRTPLFYRITVPVERRDRQFYEYPDLGFSVNLKTKKQGSFFRETNDPESVPVT